MNLASELHRLTGRTRKARRRGGRSDIRAGLLWFGVAASWAACCVCSLGDPLPVVWPLLLLSLVCTWLARRQERRSAVYQRVVDRCQGAMLLLLSIQGRAIDRTLLQRAPEASDKRRWS